MAGQDLPFQCACGMVKGTLRGVGPTKGNRVDCYCKDCRAAEVFADPKRASATGPVHLFQTAPSRISLEAGHDQLAVFAMSAKGPLRWYAKCCGTMLCNTLRTPKVAFAAMFTDCVPDAATLGPAKTRAFVTKSNGKVGHDGLRHAVLNLASTAIPARITGAWKNTPFFDTDTLKPVCDVHTLTKEERAAATAPSA